MNKEQAMTIVEPFLPEERFAHTMRVSDVAEDLATKYGENVDDIIIASIFHDYAKSHPLEDMEREIRQSSLPKDLLDYHHELWHGPVASVLIEREYGITNKPIQEAIRYHTTGRAGMSVFEMILFVADYIEPGRSIPDLDTVREAADQSLKKATWLILQRTIQFLTEKRSTIYPDTFHAYNYFTNQFNGGFE